MQKKEDETGFLRLEVSVKVTSAGDSLRVTIPLKIKEALKIKEGDIFQFIILSKPGQEDILNFKVLKKDGRQN